MRTSRTEQLDSSEAGLLGDFKVSSPRFPAAEQSATCPYTSFHRLVMRMTAARTVQHLVSRLESTVALGEAKVMLGAWKKAVVADE